MANHCRHKRKAFRMSFKKFSSAQDAPNKDGSDNKSKPAPATDRPTAQPENAPAEVAPASKP